ncbi:glycosyltransferase family 22 protein [Pterulicium gracile]|uniref:Mannosyltransferase n=1 Tax=Pterulicium gracile TaxID=1884261 RepID=A0A5C3QSS7_9AGAR|nr:glycosyltransferase family 22 protein [Pterula gracilis]
MSAPYVQGVRLRRQNETATPKQPEKEPGFAQVKPGRFAKRAWAPSFSLAIRFLLLMRVASAMYSNIEDCDEVFNFWEPLHFFHKGYGFQTWEVSPQFAIRSWAYIVLHAMPVKVASFLFPTEKRAAFFAVRITLAFISALCEAKFYRSVLENLNDRIGRYLFFILLFSAGMWNASSAFLPSSFAMYTTMLAFSYAIAPASLRNNKRTLFGTLLFATGGIVGWPFALALAVPFVVEELFLAGVDQPTSQSRSSWFQKRLQRLVTAGCVAALLFIPIIAIDTLAYGRLSIVPWNIIRYNLFGGSERGPDLYGTSPWHFYFLNLNLNFNVVTPLALFSLPAVGITYVYDRNRLGVAPPSSNQSSSFTLLATRLMPFYLWLGILTAQAHKEERFMYPAYPLLAFNAATTIYLIRGWMEVAFLSVTKSPYRTSKTPLFRLFTSSILISMSLLSLSRIIALYINYHAPLSLTHTFEYTEIPLLLNSTGLLHLPPGSSPSDLGKGYQIDITPVEELGLRVCVAKEWYRFPGHFLIPTGVRVDFVKSEFEGMLPRHFEEGGEMGGRFGWPRMGTRVMPKDLNDLNREDKSHYVPIESCDYLFDLDFPQHPVSSALEPRFINDKNTWEPVECLPFLDARHSPLLTRVLWMPGETWRNMQVFGDYCLLRNTASVAAKLEVAKTGQKQMSGI